MRETEECSLQYRAIFSSKDSINTINSNSNLVHRIIPAQEWQI